MYWVYILQSEKDGRYYVGQTQNLEQRVKGHCSGRAGWTRRKGPWKLCYQESYEKRGDALIREKFLKGLKNRSAIEQIILSSVESRV